MWLSRTAKQQSRRTALNSSLRSTDCRCFVGIRKESEPKKHHSRQVRDLDFCSPLRCHFHGELIIMHPKWKKTIHFSVSHPMPLARMSLSLQIIRQSERHQLFYTVSHSITSYFAEAYQLARCSRLLWIAWTLWQVQVRSKNESIALAQQQHIFSLRFILWCFRQT